jgi:hypothetical protein
MLEDNIILDSLNKSRIYKNRILFVFIFGLTNVSFYSMTLGIDTVYGKFNWNIIYLIIISNLVLRLKIKIQNF